MREPRQRDGVLSGKNNIVLALDPEYPGVRSIYSIYSRYLLRRRQEISCDLASSSFKIGNKIDHAKRHKNARAFRKFVDMPTLP